MNKIKKYLCNLMIIIAVLILASCSKKDNTENNKNNIPTAGEIIGKEEKNDEKSNEEAEYDFLIDITREAAGLDKIDKLEFSEFTLNERVKQILKDYQNYTDDDYTKGIELSNSIIITERFKPDIIENISIGSNIEDVKELLGIPSFQIEDFMVYKTNNYYLVFKGLEKVELAAIRSNPKDYDETILKLILQEINNPNYNDYDRLTKTLENEDINSFFEINGHIHGGGWRAESDNGILIEEFDEDTIEIYNNFEGELYNVKDNISGFDIVFENKDSYAESMIYDLKNYIYANEFFDTTGVVSPSGKYKCIYEWYNSETWYFVVRTLDYSKPDFTIPVPADDFRWLNDDYILYLDAFFTTPHLVKVDEQNTENIDLIEQIEGISQEDNIQFEIVDIKNNIIILKDENDKIYEIEPMLD